MDHAPQPFTIKHFTMVESGRLHTDIRRVIAYTRSGKQPTWPGGFGDLDGKHPVWVANVDEAVTYPCKAAEAAEAAGLWFSDLPDHEDVLYAVCHLKTDDNAS